MQKHHKMGRNSIARGPGPLTRSSDPELVKARVFVGNLPSGKVDRKDLTDVFQRYGQILAVSVIKDFGFIQFRYEIDALVAVKSEENLFLKGFAINVKMATNARSKSHSSTEKSTSKKASDQPGILGSYPSVPTVAIQEAYNPQAAMTMQSVRGVPSAAYQGTLTPQVSAAYQGTLSPQLSAAYQGTLSPQGSAAYQGTLNQQLSAAYQGTLTPQVPAAYQGALHSQGSADYQAALSMQSGMIQVAGQLPQAAIPGQYVQNRVMPVQPTLRESQLLEGSKSAEEEETPPDINEIPYWLEIRNLPAGTNDKHICFLFNDKKVHKDGIHIINGNPVVAYVAFNQDKDLLEASERNGEVIKGNTLKILLASKEDVEKAIGKKREEEVRQLLKARYESQTKRSSTSGFEAERHKLASQRYETNSNGSDMDWEELSDLEHSEETETSRERCEMIENAPWGKHNRNKGNEQEPHENPPWESRKTSSYDNQEVLQRPPWESQRIDNAPSNQRTETPYYQMDMYMKIPDPDPIKPLMSCVPKVTVSDPAPIKPLIPYVPKVTVSLEKSESRGKRQTESLSSLVEADSDKTRTQQIGSDSKRARYDNERNPDRSRDDRERDRYGRDRGSTSSRNDRERDRHDREGDRRGSERDSGRSRDDRRRESTHSRDRQRGRSDSREARQTDSGKSRGDRETGSNRETDQSRRNKTNSFYPESGKPTGSAQASNPLVFDYHHSASPNIAAEYNAPRLYRNEQGPSSDRTNERSGLKSMNKPGQSNRSTFQAQSNRVSPRSEKGDSTRMTGVQGRISQNPSQLDDDESGADGFYVKIKCLPPNPTSYFHARGCTVKQIIQRKDIASVHFAHIEDYTRVLNLNGSPLPDGIMKIRPSTKSEFNRDSKLHQFESALVQQTTEKNEGAVAKKIEPKMDDSVFKVPPPPKIFQRRTPRANKSVAQVPLSGSSALESLRQYTGTNQQYI